MKLEIILVTFYAVEPSKIKGKIVVRKTDRELQVIAAPLAAWQFYRTVLVNSVNISIVSDSAAFAGHILENAIRNRRFSSHDTPPFHMYMILVSYVHYTRWRCRKSSLWDSKINKKYKKRDDFMGQMPITRANSQIVSHQQWISYVQKPS